MKSYPLDLTNCDSEPIHIPGQIQSHGFLIAIDENFTICYHSDNINLWLGLPDNLLGRDISDIEVFFAVSKNVLSIKELFVYGMDHGFSRNNPCEIWLNGDPYYMILSSAHPYYLLELEPSVKDPDQEIQNMIGHSISQMLADRDLGHLLHNTAHQVKKIIQYDRIMVYRFAEDGHGEVVAEAKNDDLDPWLGLHYPASDIPKQARELYKTNLTRLIANVHAKPARIRTASAEQSPIDLTHSQLRAVSPIHIQYLKNMKVDSSFSISLICRDELWGLIACHNYTPRFIDYKSRESAKLIGQIFSSALEFRQDQEIQQTFGYYKMGVDSLTKNLLKSDSIRNALMQFEITMLNAVDSCGAVLVYENQISKLGITPTDSQLSGLIAWLKKEDFGQNYFTSQLSSVYPDAADFQSTVCGMMVSVLSKEDGAYAIWFKPEIIQTVRWAGNPDKATVTGDNSLGNISPRNSFEVWSQTVTGISKNWNSEEIKSVTRLREEIIYVINQKAGESKIRNEKLQLAYKELDTFSFTIAHDLKNPLSSVKGYADLLKMESHTPDVENSIDRIIAGANKMNRMITEILEHSKVGQSEITKVQIEIRPLLDEFIRDIKVVFHLKNIEFSIGETPGILGDPVMISQVFVNLLSNAVKYSGNSAISKIRIEGREEGNEIIYSVADNGLGIETSEIPRIFQLFQRLGNVDHIEGSGVGLAIVKRIMDKHDGTIRVESTPGAGSIFYMAFKKS